LTFFTKKKQKNNLPHWGDAKNWVLKCIESCETSDQLNTAQKMIEFYWSQYYYEMHFETLHTIYGDLNDKWYNRLKEIKVK